MAATRRIFLLLIAVNIGLAESSFASFARSGTIIIGPAPSSSSSTASSSPPSTERQRARAAAAVVVRVVPPRPRESNWEDDTKSSRTNAEVTDYVPPWRDHQQHQRQRQRRQEEETTVSGDRRATATTPENKDATTPLPSFARSVARAPNSGAGLEGAVPPPPSRASAAPMMPPTSSSLPNAADSGTPLLLRGVRWPLVRDPPGTSIEYPLSYVRTIVAFLSTVSTWHIHSTNAHSPVLAASVTTMIVSTCLDRRLGDAALCGSLAGMSGTRLVPDLATAATLGALSSMAYEASTRVFVRRRPSAAAGVGVGGAAGAAAFLATSVLAWHRGIGIVSVTTRRAALRRGVTRWGVSVGSGAAAAGSRGGLPPLGDTILPSMVLYHVLGAVVTICLRECSDDSGAADPARASSVVGLLGSLFLRGGDATAILALYGGSFVGMSLPSRLMHGNVPGRDAGAGALAGLFHAMTMRYGVLERRVGGKAGLCAFAGCWAYRGFGNAVDFVRSRRKK
ncbi:hypothetical protein ACHAW5_004856 [Stephanodiscus triporus]|uniref:Peptidase S54 rhomboid domain-containing protein n=1 Tax=Stephanodiscus triporus TaxID=2934178 RepID=A0ABD3NHA5_9STRA